MSVIQSFGNVTICWDPVEEYSRRSEGVSWCFKCRTRVEFFTICYRPVDPLSYYGPSSSVKCSSCSTVDGDCFPGWSREVADY